MHVVSRRKAYLVIAFLFCFGLLLGAVTQISLTSQVFGILPGANGGTASAFFSVTGPTALRAFTFPDAASTVLTSNSAVTVPQGGSGAATFTNHGVLLGQSASPIAATSVGASGSCFMGNTGADPSFQTCPGALNFADNQTPTGTINGVNTTFTLANTPSPAASLDCYLNGIRQKAGGADFTLATATITYGVAPATGAILTCDYRW